MKRALVDICFNFICMPKDRRVILNEIAASPYQKTRKSFTLEFQSFFRWTLVFLLADFMETKKCIHVEQSLKKLEKIEKKFVEKF